MLLVDTSVWIDFFNGSSTQQVRKVETALTHATDICICGVILTEILQGIHNPTQHRKVAAILDSFTYLEAQQNTYLDAAAIYRKVKEKGYTTRKTIGCIIAAIALEHHVALLHNDKDFLPIQKYCGLITA